MMCNVQVGPRGPVSGLGKRRGLRDLILIYKGLTNASEYVIYIGVGRAKFALVDFIPRMYAGVVFVLPLCGSD